MAAHMKMKIEIEGTGTGVREALEDLLGRIVLEEVRTSPPLLLDPTLMVTDEVLDDMAEINKMVRSGEIEPLGAEKFCKHCGKALTEKQIKTHNKYCSLKCASLHKPKKLAVKKAKEIVEASEPKLSKQVKELTGRTCLQCGKELTRSQKKFCSQLHSNQYNNNIRRGVTVTKKAPSRKFQTKSGSQVL